MWRKISRQRALRLAKGEDEKCAVEQRWKKRRDGRCEKDAEHAYAQTKRGRGREKGDLVGVGCAKDIAECI